MKASEIQVGEIYGIGNFQGRHGVSYTGQKARLIERNVPEYPSSSKRDHFKVAIVDDEGNDRLRDNGEKWTRILSAREIISMDEVLRREEEQRIQQEKREQRKAAIDELGEEMAELIEKTMEISSDDYSVRVGWNADSEAPMIHSIHFSGPPLGNGVSALVLAMAKFRETFEPVELPDDDDEEPDEKPGHTTTLKQLREAISDEFIELAKRGIIEQVDVPLISTRAFASVEKALGLPSGEPDDRTVTT